MTLHVDLVHAQEKDADEATAITSFNELWNPAQEDADKARLIRLEGQVLFYDPSWGMLWLHDGEPPVEPVARHTNNGAKNNLRGLPCH